MSQEMAVFSANAVPDYIREEGQTALTKAVTGDLRKSISIRGKVFRCVVGGDEVAKKKDFIDVVFVNIAKDNGRIYYSKPYDAKNEKYVAPDCWSADGRVPSEESKAPQSETCQTCPMNIAGSGQGNSRACRFARTVAVVVADDPASGVYKMQIPAKSLFGQGTPDKMPLEKYFKYVASQNHSIDRLITRITMDDNEDSPVLTFSAVNWVSREMLPVLKDLAESKEAAEAARFYFPKERAESEEGAAAPEEPVIAKSSKPKDVSVNTDKPDLAGVLNKFKDASKSTDTDDE